MKDLSMKQNVLKEIMDLMEAREGESLKSHPKFAKAMPEAKEEAPELEEEIESPEVEESEGAEGELSDEDLQMLLEKFKEMQ